MIQASSFNFSFSGLKTAVLYYLRDHPRFSPADVAASFQTAAVDVLTAKTLRAMKKFRSKTLLIGGGVAANKKLQKQLSETLSMEIPDSRFMVPDRSLTGDNALMIAIAAFFRKQKPPKSIRADGSLRLAN